MADVVLNFAIKKLDVLISQEFGLLSGVNGGINDIRNALGRMMESLRNADASQGDMKKMTQELRQVAFQSEDVIDEFLRMKYDGRRGMSRFTKNPVSRHKIGKTVESIKSELQKIRERDKIFPGTASNAPVVEAAPSQLVASALFEREEEESMKGMEEPSLKLRKLICSDGHNSAPKVISVDGMGGLGKSTLVNKVYDDLVVKKSFTNYAWITVTGEFNSIHLLKDLISQLCKDSLHLHPEPPQNLEKMTRTDMMREVEKLLREDAYLIVLDDVWSISAWDDIKRAFPLNKLGRVVITTRDTQVSTEACRFEDQIYHLQPLSRSYSRALFHARSFRDGRCPDELKEICEDILNRCEGIPLAIRMIGSVLFTKHPPTLDDCRKIISDIGADVHDNHPLKRMHNILLFSYHGLPDHLKICLLYMSMFPGGYLIECQRLIRLWISEGFIERRGQDTLEQIAESDYLKELINRSLVQVAEKAGDGRVRKVRMYNLVRDRIVTISRDEDFAAIVKASDRMPDNPRRLAVHNSSMGTEKIQSLYHLRSLLLFEVRESVPNPPLPVLSGRFFRLLTVLDLQGSSLNEFPESIVKLVNLRFLSLRHTMVSMVPSGISKLRNLETLDLKHTQVSELPAGIIKLTKLRNLLLYHFKLKPSALAHTKHGFQAPHGINGLKSLQKLCFVKAGIEDEVVVGQLGELSGLTRLGIIELSKHNDKGLCLSISKLTKLEALSITLSSEEERLKLKELEAGHNLSSCLRRLHLTGKLKRLPDWMRSLQNLVKIILKSSKLSESPLEAFEGFPNLLHVELIQAYTGKTLCFKEGKFKNLKFLGLRELNELDTVTLENTSMPNLERLTIERCERMKAVPSGIEDLANLKVLDFVNMPRELIVTMHPSREAAADYWKIRHIPVVNFSYDLLDHLWTETLSSNTQSTYHPQG